MADWTARLNAEHSLRDTTRRVWLLLPCRRSKPSAQGAAEGSKDRPCVIVVAARRDSSGDITTIVAPVTHQPPRDRAASIEIPPWVCRSLAHYLHRDPKIAWNAIRKLEAYQVRLATA